MEVASIYDNGPVSPVAKVGENLAVWRDQSYYPYKIEWMEGIPRSSPFVIDMVATSGAVTIPAGGQTQKSISTVLQMYPDELLHLRWEPIDDVEGLLWELNNQARNATKGGQARTGPFTSLRDPWLATTTFWILGQNRDCSIGAFNPWAIAQPTARFAFWGFRYILRELRGIEGSTAMKGPITYLPVQGR
jgi:hypothetical protein